MPNSSAVRQPPKITLGRPRGFDADAALRAALEVFWCRGYAATSLDNLSDAMGLSRSSFYACFGSKHELLMASVQLYADERFAALTARLTANPDPRAAIHEMLAAIANIEGGSRGCLFVNAVAELAPGDAEMVAFAQAHTTRVAGLMTATLVGLGCTQREAADCAGALLALVMGVTTLRKTGVPTTQLKSLLAQADHLLPRKNSLERNTHDQVTAPRRI